MNRLNPLLVVFAFALTFQAAGCGGGQDTDSTSSNLGESNKGDDLDVPDKQGDAAAESTEPDADGGTAAPPASSDPFTFVIKNSASDDLVFSMDKGWQPNIFGFSGKPPKAVSIIMFPKFCSAACDAPEEGRCPYCPEPERVRDIRKAEKRKVVSAGQTLEVPWDGKVFGYQRTKGTRKGRTKRCECYKKQDAPAATYTVRVCGLRVTKSAKQRSRLQCEDASMTLPSDEPQRIELEFGDKETK